MKKVVVAVFAAILVLLVGPRMACSQTQQSNASRLVAVMRYVGTEEGRLFAANHKYATQAELTHYVQKNGPGYAQPEDISAQALKPYVLHIMMTPDSTHFEDSLTRSTDIHDKSTWCQPAFFSDDRGLIYMGLGLGCQAPGQPAH